jgi:hypothetical protein
LFSSRSFAPPYRSTNISSSTGRVSIGVTN